MYCSHILNGFYVGYFTKFMCVGIGCPCTGVKFDFRVNLAILIRWVFDFALLEYFYVVQLYCYVMICALRLVIVMCNCQNFVFGFRLPPYIEKHITNYDISIFYCLVYRIRSVKCRKQSYKSKQ